MSKDIEFFKKISAHGKPGWKSQTSSFAPRPSLSSSKPVGGGIIGSAVGVLDPPRQRPFIKPYNLSSLSYLKYFKYATQQLEGPQQSSESVDNSYDRLLRDAKHYELYLARLLLSIRRQRGFYAFQRQLFDSGRTSQEYYRRRRSYNAFRYFFAQSQLGKRKVRRLPKQEFPESGEASQPSFPTYPQLSHNPLAKTFRRFNVPPTPWIDNPVRPTPIPDRFDYPKSEEIYGGRWKVIRRVQLSKTKQKIWIQHTKTKEIRTVLRYNEHKSLPTRNFYGRNRYRNSNYSRYRHRPYHKPFYSRPRWRYS